MNKANSKSLQAAVPGFGGGVMNRQDLNEAKLARIAKEAQAFYDRHPYPPPVKELDDYRLRWQDQSRRRANYHLYWPDQPYRDGLNILVAGCGTSQAARHALRNPENRITGIDVSSTSIRHTEALKHKYELVNLDIYQLPIERVRELNQRFDKILCTGVLHHLLDPDAGLRALSRVLKSDGAMHLMVYAAYGRTGIYMLQEYCRRLGVGRSEKDILDLAHTLMLLPPAHPLANLLAESPDFRSKAGLADALLHPLDRAYTVPQLFEFIDRAGLVFGRWVRQAPYLPQCGTLAQTPHGARLNRLAPPDQYAAVELFRGTMVRHSAVVYRSDRPGDGRSLRFDDERWQHYVPIRLPRTLCIEENLPAGAAAVLLNQSHTYSDLVLPIDLEQKRLFEAIDGQDTIAAILERVADRGKRNNEHARTFFEQLWRYDQVVFDASRQMENSDDGNH
ncbi:MAG: class I SAM-dependent methyltransferase [Desulfobacterales bacterium]|jgi:2-polyprenyl-3-methyl-5-hydroxy-6-metoxy-1,4-benzoquinol methylase